MKFAKLLSAAFIGISTSSASADGIKLYTLDCGTIQVSDMASFDNKGRLNGQSSMLKVPCYLIRHAKGDMLWDAGFNETMVDNPPAKPNGAFLASMTVKLTDQLAQLGLAPSDIEYLALSHWHPDHSGNAGLFANSVWVVNRAERDFMFSDAMRAANSDYAALETATTIQFDDTYDVFGDGTAVITSTPGHTSGHSVLLLTLEKAGAMLFSGDLYTHARGREIRAIPTFNVDAEQTIKSMALFEQIAIDNNARVIIEHEKTHFDALPKFPNYLK